MMKKSIKGICFRNRNENIFEIYEKNKGLLIVYGATAFSKILLGEGYKADYVCDKQADIIHEINGVPVIDCNQLRDLVEKSGKRATIIICVGLRKVTVLSIFSDLIKLNMDADIFDYFENSSIFADRNFIFNGKEYELFEHSYNCGYIDTRMTERSVEVALAKE